MKLQAKMLLGVLGAAVVVFGLMIFGVIWQVSASSTRFARDVLQSNSIAAANAITEDMISNITAVKALADLVSALDYKDDSARYNIVNMAKTYIEANPEFAAVWIICEPNAYDGEDARYADTDEFRRGDGRMIVTYSWENGKAVRSTSVLKQETLKTADWYQIPLTAGKESVSEPLLYSYTGKTADNILMTTYGAPVKRDGKTIGVVGIDVSLEEMDKIVSNLTIPEGASAALVSNGGTIVSGFGKESLGKNYRELGFSETDTVLSDIKNGKSSFYTSQIHGAKDDVIVFREAVRLANTGTPWSLSVSIPASIVNMPARLLTRHIIIGALVGILVLGVVVTLLVRRIVKPIHITCDRLSRFGELDLSEIADALDLRKGNDEIGEMTRVIHKLQSVLREMVQTLESETDNFTASSELLSSISAESVAASNVVNEAVEKVFLLLEQNNKSLETTNTGAQDVATAASSAAEMATGAADNASRTSSLSDSAVKEVENVVSEMDRLREHTLVCDDNIKELSTSVGSISSFVSSISSIATQTNLLALNAAIEAARAGDAGRGFAVVADEVRKLAEESNSAAKQVATLVTSLGQATEASQSVFSELRDGLAKVQDDAKRAVSNLGQAQDEINKVAGAIQGMAAASEEQAANSSEMTESIKSTIAAIGDVQRVVENIRVSAKETLTTSEHVENESQNLAQGSEKLKELLSQFTI
ncbi:methyl-accepting chemotaxis protein [Synergistales bacterium]|nr:methyl-accepting chemotaxis protein [Synergistales bacterium]